MRVILILLFLGINQLLWSQSIQASTISPAGTTLQAEGVSLQFSIGEPMNTLVDEGGMSIAQGLLQAIISKLVTSIRELAIKDLSVYPNPFREKMVIQADPQQRALNYKLINVHGVSILEGILQTGVEELNLPELLAGAYFLTIQDRSTGESQTISLIKTK